MRRAGASNASVFWLASTATGGSPITGYLVRALPMAADGVTVSGPARDTVVGAAARNATVALPTGRYRFVVFALNAIGQGAPSAGRPWSPPGDLNARRARPG